MDLDSKTLHFTLTGAFAVNLDRPGGATSGIMNMQVSDLWRGCRGDVLLVQGWDGSCPTSLYFH